MAESTEHQVADLKSATTEISYCPHLNLYHYKRADGDEFFFDTAQLEASIENYLKQGSSREADFMAQLTAWARKFPHKTATFYADGRFEVRKLEPHKNDEEIPSSDQSK
jgi:hypothetical protein